MFNMNATGLQSHNERFNQAVSSSLFAGNDLEEDDMCNQDSKSETLSKSGNAKSKMFQCTGYGECRMVFTRSEHLARHMRKHTGEKPFQCVVPGCERMFSRFDNMMQHTQTHNKTRGSRRTKPASTKSKRGGKRSNGNMSRRAATTGTNPDYHHQHYYKSNNNSSSSDYDEYGLLPSPPPSRRGSSINIIKEHQIILPNPKYLEVDEDIDELMSSDDDYDYDYTPNTTTTNSTTATRKAIASTSRLPDSPASSDSSSANNNNDTTCSTTHRRRSTPQVRYQPYPYNHHSITKNHNSNSGGYQSIPRRNSALSELATYLVDHPDQSPESYLTSFHNKYNQQQHQPLPPRLPTRRLSIQDLSNPIEKLDDSKQEKTNFNKAQGPEQQKQDGIDLTEDEFQAIQGFGKFYKSAITCYK